MKNILLTILLSIGLLAADDLRSVCKVEGVAALRGNYKAASVEVMMNESTLAIIYTFANISDSVVFNLEQTKYLVANINLYLKHIANGNIPNEGSVISLGNTYCTVVVLNNNRIYKSSTGVYFNLHADRSMEFFIPESKFVDGKTGEFAGVERIWGLMLPRESVNRIIEALKEIAKSEDI